MKTLQNIILLSEKQTNWSHSVLCLNFSSLDKQEIPFSLTIKPDLYDFFKPHTDKQNLMQKTTNLSDNQENIAHKKQCSTDNQQNTIASKQNTSDIIKIHQKDESSTQALYATSLQFMSLNLSNSLPRLIIPEEISPVKLILLENSDSLVSCKQKQDSQTSLDAPIYLTETATSSLDIAHFLVRNQNPNITIPPFTSILCRNQTKGRGQLRRDWSSPEGNIYAALFLPKTAPFSTDSAAPALGAMLCHALNQLGFKVSLKWPNDIIQKNVSSSTNFHNNTDTYKKVAGILLEERNNFLIAGIGINIHSAPPTSALRENYFMPAGTLKKKTFLQNPLVSLQNYPKRNIFLKNTSIRLKKITQNLIKKVMYPNRIKQTFLEILPLWSTLVEQIFLCYKKLEGINNEDCAHTSWQKLTKKYLTFLGEEVNILHPIIKAERNSTFEPYKNDEYIRGTVCGINTQGELLLQVNNQIITILGGTFSQEK